MATSIAYGPVLTKVIDHLSAAFDIKKEVIMCIYSRTSKTRTPLEP